MRVILILYANNISIFVFNKILNNETENVLNKDIDRLAA